jgi:hypothetical protein
MASWNWGSVADWAQAISSTVVLLLIYLQMRQVNSQMLQNEAQERFRRSWEFVRLYRDELREYEHILENLPTRIDKFAPDPNASELELLNTNFLQPRIHLFILLNNLVQHQEVDERVLFGYLEDEFNQFVQVGIKRSGLKQFKKEVGTKMNLLMTLWGTQIKCKELLKANKGIENAEPTSA